MTTSPFSKVHTWALTQNCTACAGVNTRGGSQVVCFYSAVLPETTLSLEVSKPVALSLNPALSTAVTGTSIILHGFKLFMLKHKCPYLLSHLPSPRQLSETLSTQAFFNHTHILYPPFSPPAPFGISIHSPNLTFSMFYIYT